MQLTKSWRPNAARLAFFDRSLWQRRELSLGTIELHRCITESVGLAAFEWLYVYEK